MASVTDYNFGIECENLFLNNSYGLKKIKNKNDTFDFINKKNKILIELKSRKYNFNSTLKDWQIGINKINEAKKYYNMGYTIYFYNLFYDGLYYWKYKQNKVKTDLYIKLGGRNDRQKNEIKNYYYIKSSKMKKSKIDIKTPHPLDKCLI